MLVQDPLSGCLHEVPDVPPYYGGYGGGYYGGYDEYVDPSMAEYPGELGGLGMLFLPKIIRAITGRGGLPLPPLPPLAPLSRLLPLSQLLPLSHLAPPLQPAMTYPPGAGFAPPPEMQAYPPEMQAYPPEMQAYIAAMVRDLISRSAPGVNPVFSQGGFRRRRRRRR